MVHFTALSPMTEILRKRQLCNLVLSLLHLSCEMNNSLLNSSEKNRLSTTESSAPEVVLGLGSVGESKGASPLCLEEVSRSVDSEGSSPFLPWRNVVGSILESPKLSM